MNDEFAAALSEGAICVTATERLASFVRGEYARKKAATGAACWIAPEALSWESWVRSLWERRWSERTVLPRHAASVLWEEIIAADAARSGIELLDVAATAEAAMQAHSLVALYEIPVDNSFAASDECAAFFRWRAEFMRRLADRKWLTAEAFDSEAAELFSGGLATPPGRIVFSGFDEELPPARRKVALAAKNRGAKVLFAALPESGGSPRRVSCADLEDEARRAALWAVERLAANPLARVGIVAIDMGAAREAVERVFPALLTPSSTISGDGLEKPPFDLSLGGPLSGEAVVETAFLLIAAHGEEITLGDFRKLLNSPFWDAGAERFPRSSLARRLTRLGRTRLSLGQVGAELSRGDLAGAAGAKAVGARLLGLAAMPSPEAMAPPSVFAAAFTAFLEASGWGSAAALGSREYQAAGHFSEALATLASLDAVKPGCDRRWALSRLASLASAPFRPKVGEARIQVMGMLEAAGFTFDCLWVLGASDRALPAETRANPFIPYDRQLAARMRQASPALELARAKEIIRRLAASAPEVWFSSPGEEEGAKAEPSPLIASFPEGEPAFSIDLSIAEQVRGAGATALERRGDRSAPVGAAEEFRGGSNLFLWQARCPFRAYVGLRLGARDEEAVEEGLDPRLKGEIVHHAVRELHGIFPTSGSISAASDAEVEDAIERAIAAGLKGAAKALGGQNALMEVEGDRLRELLRGWLAVERERPDFAVLEREAGRRMVIGGIEVNLRIDRLDSTDGGELVIDYKTGSQAPSAKALKAERLTEPQLPLYALACENSSGVAYAHLRRGDCKLIGVAESDSAAGVRREEDWQALKLKWRERLEALALEFMEGRADPDPSGLREYCENCGFDSICRVSGEAGGGEEGE